MHLDMGLIDFGCILIHQCTAYLGAVSACYHAHSIYFIAHRQGRTLKYLVRLVWYHRVLVARPVSTYFHTEWR